MKNLLNVFNVHANSETRIQPAFQQCITWFAVSFWEEDSHGHERELIDDAYYQLSVSYGCGGNGYERSRVRE
jgi:hypothetical protein